MNHPKVSADENVVFEESARQRYSMNVDGLSMSECSAEVIRLQDVACELRSRIAKAKVNCAITGDFGDYKEFHCLHVDLRHVHLRRTAAENRYGELLRAEKERKHKRGAFVKEQAIHAVLKSYMDAEEIKRFWKDVEAAIEVINESEKGKA